MGTMRSFNKCDPERDYTYVELLEWAVAYDLEFLEDIAKNGTDKSKKNLAKVAEIMDEGYDDSWSDSGNYILYNEEMLNLPH